MVLIDYMRLPASASYLGGVYGAAGPHVPPIWETEKQGDREVDIV